MVQIKMKSDARVVGYTETGLAFNDGSTLDADVIIFCTGFEGNMRVLVRSIVGDDVADQLDDWWGLDAEGEIRGAWKPCGRTYHFWLIHVYLVYQEFG